MKPSCLVSGCVGAARDSDPATLAGISAEDSSCITAPGEGREGKGSLMLGAALDPLPPVLALQYSGAPSV